MGFWKAVAIGCPIKYASVTLLKLGVEGQHVVRDVAGLTQNIGKI